MSVLPPVPHNTPFQDDKTQRITPPWLRWLDLLRSKLNATSGGGGVSDHEALSNVTSDQHHAQEHTHLSSFGETTALTAYRAIPASGSSSSLSRSDHNHGSVPPINIGFKHVVWWAWPSDSQPAHILSSSTGASLAGVSATAVTVDQSTLDELAATVRSDTSGSVARFSSVNQMHYSNNLVVPTFQPFNFGLYLFLRLKLTSITNSRFRVIMGNQGLSNTDNPWGASGNTGGLAFNFLPALSPNWFAVGKVATVATLGFSQDLGVPVVANKIYNLEIVVKGTGTNRVADFYIDGVKYYTEIGNTRYSAFTASIAGWDAVLYPLAAEAKQLSIFSAVWGRRPTVTKIPNPVGYESYPESN